MIIFGDLIFKLVDFEGFFYILIQKRDVAYEYVPAPVNVHAP